MLCTSFLFRKRYWYQKTSYLPSKRNPVEDDINVGYERIHKRNDIDLRFSRVRRRKTPVPAIPFANTGKIYYNICPSKCAQSIRQRA